MRKQTVIGLTAALFCHSSFGIVLGGARTLPEVITETLPMSAPEHEIPLMIHRMASTPASVASRNQRFIFADETLMKPDATEKDEFDWCVKAGAVAVVQDDMTKASVQAARDAGVKLILMPNMSPMRLAWYGASDKDPDSVARYWVKMIQETEQWSDALYHQDGRVVMWLFDATGVPADFYPQVRAKVRELGYDPCVVYHAQLRKGHDTEEAAKAYLQIFDGALVWGGGYEPTRDMLQLVVPARDRIEKETGERKQIIVTTKPGHWRPEKGSLIDGHGTKELRDTIDLAYTYQLDGLNIESWNDYSETHHIQPSVLKSTVLSDLCMYYGRLGTGQSTAVEWPGLYVSHRRDVVAGEYFECEVLYLPIAGEQERTARLILKSPDGAILYSSKPWKIAAGDAGTKTFNIPTLGMGVPATILPVLEINAAEQPTETFCEVNASRMRYPFTMHMSLAKALHPLSVEFSIDGHSPGSTFFSNAPRNAEISVQCDEKISRIEIIKNQMPVYSAAFDRMMQEKAAGKSYQIAGFYWDIPGPVKALKDEPLNGMDFCGTIDLTDGTALHAVHIKNSLPAWRSPTHVEWGMDASRKRPHDAIEIAFDGDSNTVFNLHMPKQKSDLKIRWGDIPENGVVEFPLLSHTRLLVKPMSGPIGHPLELGVTNYSGTAVLPLLEDRPWNTYFLRIITEDGKIFRSAPIHITTVPPVKTTGIYTWDSSARLRVEIEVPKAAVEDVSWPLEADGPRMIADVNHLGYELELGGLFERDGRFYDDQIPVRVMDGDHAALRFDGNDIAMTRPQLIPLGAWAIDLKIKPEKPGMKKDQVIFKVAEAIEMVLQPDGKIRVWFGDRQENTRLYSQRVLRKDQWTRISFVYDLNDILLLVDGTIEAGAPAEGFRERITQRASFGAAFPVSHMKPAEHGFFGLMRDIALTVQADRISALKNGLPLN